MSWSSSRPDPEPARRAADEPDDASLVSKAQADPPAFAALYERYLERVYRYCYLRLGSREAAEDATSEVFLKALAGLDGFRGDLFAAWLFQIAHNVVVDAYRRSRPAAPLEAADAVSDPDRTPEEQSVARDERRGARAALTRLPSDQQTAIELQLAGWTVEQTARLLGKSLGAVKMLRFRAVASLRETLRSETAPSAREARDA